MKIPFNKPHLTGKEISHTLDAHSRWWLAGDGYYTKRCQNWIEKTLHTKKALLTHSCTGAMEMMAILGDLASGDEIIMPSFTFASTANAVVLRGGVPVFVDIRLDTLNIDEKLIEKAITRKTKAIMVVHYAGVGCEMDVIKKIAQKHKLLVLEDAAMGLLAKYKNRYLGTIGHMGAFSFHETKNIISGEGGMLVINTPKFVKRAEIIREKGTNRSQFFRGKVDKYTWVDIGSSYLPSEVIAAFLMAQFENAHNITKKRIQIWNKYHKLLEGLEVNGHIRRPIIPKNIKHNGHMYYILTKDSQKLINFLKKRGILAPFHYVPLHSSPAGKRFAKVVGPMNNTNTISRTLIRLPLFYDIKQREIEFVVKSIEDFFKGGR